jgi:hypothetical protein
MESYIRFALIEASATIPICRAYPEGASMQTCLDTDRPATGWEPTREEIERDVHDLHGGSLEKFIERVQ